MNPNLQRLHALGQSLWVDNITRKMLGDGTLQGYIDELSVTGLTSNPTIFEQAIGAGDLYDEQIAELSRRGRFGEDLFFELALRDLRQAADLFRPVFDATDGVDGWVSLEVSPAIVDDTARTTAAAGARPQRLLWASTGTKDPDAPDTLYLEALAAPDTVDTIPDKTLEAFAEHGKVGAPLAVDGGDAEEVIAGFRQLGVDDAALALRLQKEGAASFQKSWDSLLAGLRKKTLQSDGVFAW
jgi:transaldolase